MSKSLRILILEDRPADAELVERELRQAGFEFAARIVATKKEFLAALRDFALHLILADYSLPGYDGMLALAAAQKQCPATPFIFVSGKLGEDLAVESMRRGATDYVLKDRLERLGPAVRHALREREGIRRREQAEKEMLEAEARYRTLFTESPDGIVILDPETARPIEFNTAAHRQLGYSREEFARLSLADIEAKETPGQTRATIAGVCHDGKRDFETLHRTRDGQIRHVHVTAQTLQASGRSVYHCIWRDITERKQSEESLSKSELFAKSVLNALTAHIAVVDAQGTILAVNEAWRRFGRENGSSDPAAYVGANYLAVCQHSLPGSDKMVAEAVLRGLRSVIQGEREEFSTEYHCHSPEQPRWFNVRVTRFPGEGTARVVVAHENITERRQLEEALRESGQFNQQVIANAEEGIVVYGRDLRYQLWNPFMEQLTGLPAGKVLGRHPDELFPFLREKGVLASLQKALAGETTPTIDFAFSGMPSGRSGWTSDTNCPLRNAAGEIIGAIGIVRDITGRKRAELRTAAFASLGQRLNSAKTAREAGDIIVKVADELIGWDSCLFHLYSASEHRLSTLVCMDLIGGRRTECQPPGFPRSPTEYTRRAIKEGGQLILRNDSAAFPPEGLPFGDASRPSASLMFVPVRHGSEVVGILSIQSYKPKAYGPYDLETLQALADHGGGALERLRAEEALGESVANFGSVWEHSIDGMRLTDKDGRIIAVNEAFCRLVKLPREKLEGQIFSAAYRGHGPDDGIEVYHRRFAAGEIAPRLMARVQLWNAEELDLEISNSFIEASRHGKLLLGICRDVSERKRSELRVEAFSHLGQQLSAAKDPAEAARAIYAGADQFWKWDCGVLDLESAEPGRVETALAYDVVDGQRREVTPADPVGPCTDRIRRIMEQGAELILRKPEELRTLDTVPFGDTSRLSASIMCVPVRVENRAVGVLSIQSYTPDAFTREDLRTLQALADHCGGALDRLRVEKALRGSEVRYRRLFESAKDGILILDAKTGMILDVNPFLTQLLGFTREALLGKRVWELGFLQDLVANEAKFAELQRKEYVRYDNLPLETSDGRRIEVEFFSNVYTVNDQQVIQCDIRDISERKALEEQLRQAQKMEAVGQLAGGVAHDFNNLLAVIRGNAELLLMEELQVPPEGRECMQHVVEASERAANLTRQLLAFSRKQILQPQALVLNEIIANLTKMLKRIIGENINLQCQYAAALAHVQADPGMMEQVLLNLVVNARDAMPAGGQLRVATSQLRLDEAHARAYPEARAGDFVCLSVSDTGSGIAPEVLPRIFEPFFTTKEVGKGTGLGLVIVYGIVKQHQGWIEVSSRVGAGTTFKVFLPAISAPASSAAVAEAAVDLPGGAETILLVEDESAVRVITRRVLVSQGYRIREAANAREALAVWRSHAAHIDLLLTDMMMPGQMTGRDLAEELRKLKPDLKVIFMSGYSTEVVGNLTDYIQRTGSLFLQKPVAVRTLLETVRKFLDGKEPAAQAPP